ncbi:hypothetical protein VQ042_20140 [Aurantimonas sp. A2-1-M11]|uniref:hypothetical protein n=1 Tax=Aurantimonas sp. A2-1-M11 TaxID=3113712 RepID=UPI002F92C180
MTDFFDWLTVNDSGLGTDRLADAFKLSRQEIRRTTEALAPAFTLALQRAMTDPAAWADVSRQFLPFMSGVGTSGPETAHSSAAKGLADSLFGSRDIFLHVARKVSTMSDVAPDTVEKLMRSLSVMSIQTMMQMMLANMARQQPAGFAEGNYPVAMAEMMRRGANAMEAMGRPSDDRHRRPASGAMGSDYLSGLFSDALNGRLPWLPPGASDTAQAGSAGQTAKSGGGAAGQPAFDPFQPFEAMLATFTQTMGGAGPAGTGPAADEASSETRAEASGKPQAAPTSDTEAAASGEANGQSFDELARAGMTMQEEFARQMLDLFNVPGSADPTGKSDGAKGRDSGQTT